MNRYKFDMENHIHTLDGKPLTGCSTIVSVLNKPLSWWASGKAVEFMGWIHGNPKVNGKYKKTPLEERKKIALPVLEKIRKMDVEEYIVLLDSAYKAHSVKLKDSAQEGIDLHAELEQFIKDTMSACARPYHVPLSFAAVTDEKINPFIKWSDENVEKFLWSEGYCYSEPLWTGGIADFGALLKNGEIILGDFKSAKEAYSSHFLQCAGYAKMIDENGIFDKDGNFIEKFEPIKKVIVFPFGAETLKPYIKEADTFKKGFENCTNLYRLLKSQEE